MPNLADISKPQAVYMKDFEPYPYQLSHIHLNFDIQKRDHVIVTNRMTLEHKSDPRPLVLTGKEFKVTPTFSITDATGAKTTVEGSTSYDSLAASTVYTFPPTCFPNEGKFDFESITVLDVENNKTGEGLYQSQRLFITQCEPEGFRKITPSIDRPDVMTVYTVRIEAEKEEFPTLLSNGDDVDCGELPAGRHFVVYKDPWPKPSYLFAVVMGKLWKLNDTFLRRTGGVPVQLNMWTETEDLSKLHWAMESLKKSFKWDEDTFGRVYDLDQFNVVSCQDFNSGAMENKSLNIFNAACLFYRPDCSRDVDATRVLRVVGHEYFHNWSGNRVTCRDWFQLTLKEGLTVYRDAVFSSDVHSDVRRIEDVRLMESTQFSEAMSSMKHPIRPEQYESIDNFYTATVYYKGAEVIRMIASLIGKDHFRIGTDHYFAKHDGQACTCEDFLAAMREGNSAHPEVVARLDGFERWYSAIDTPTVTLEEVKKEPNGQVHITLAQSTPQVYPQGPQPLTIPVRMGFIGKDSKTLLKEELLVLKDTKQTFMIESLPEEVVLSCMREFSAPVYFSDLRATREDELFRLAHDTDPYVKYATSQKMMAEAIIDLYKDDEAEVSDAIIQALRMVWEFSSSKHCPDPSLYALILSIPTRDNLMERLTKGHRDPVKLMKATGKFCEVLGAKIGDTLDMIVEAYCRASEGPFSSEVSAIAARTLGTLALTLKAKSVDIGSAAEVKALLGIIKRLEDSAKSFEEQYVTTDVTAILGSRTEAATCAVQTAMQRFYQYCAGDILMENKWLELSFTYAKDTAAIRALCEHPLMKGTTNPNRLRSAYMMAVSGNKAFHCESGAGYQWLGETIIQVDGFNPIFAGGLSKKIINHADLEPTRAKLLKDTVLKILNHESIGPQVKEVLGSSIN